MLQGSKTMTQGTGRKSGWRLAASGTRQKHRAQSAEHRAEERHAAGQQKNTLYRVLVRYNNVITWFKVLFLTARYIERDCTTAGPQDRKTAGPQDRKTAGPQDRKTPLC